MIGVGVHEAKTTLSELLRRVATGEEVTITSGGRTGGEALPGTRQGPRTFGADRGRFVVPEDFNEPLPDFESISLGGGV
jgi:antitoxin (DNA-binding transcriptional repressor) of toxin-antitoxin stability system